MIRIKRIQILLAGLLATACLADGPLPVPATQPAPADGTARRSVTLSAGGTVDYLVTPPRQTAAPDDRWMLIFLHGAGGSLKGYNLARPQYAKIREALADHGAYVVVPELGPLHFMNADARIALSQVIDQVQMEYQIDSARVHLMGTSMGGGSVLAYAVNYPDRVRSVCAIMPMTDFATWAAERPKYGERLKVAYGGTPQEKPEAYEVNSAIKHSDKLSSIRVLLVHGSADPTVPVEHSDRLADLLKSRGSSLEYIRIENAGHSDDIVAGVQEQIIRFLIDASGAKQP